MRNFDEERAERRSRPRTFQLGGEVFTYKIGMRPEEYAEAIHEYSNMLTTGAARARALEASANGENGDLPEPTKNEDSIGIMDRTLKNFLASDDDCQRYDRLRQRKDDDPITGYDIGRVVAFVIAEQMGQRPTEAPDSSTSGRDETGKTSMANSSSVPEAVVVSEA
jgi:hypothetical protein